MSEVLSTVVSEFRGDFPEVPFAPGVDVAAFKAEEKPFFVTLKIGKVGARSTNMNRPLKREEVLRVVQEVNDKRPEGNLGHVPKEKRSTEYGLPKLQWVGALLDEATGIAWGKAYVPNYAADVREFFMNKIRTNGRVGTSIYGVQGERGLVDMTLESIDIGHPDRVSVPDATTVPKITSELDDNGGGNTVSDDIKIVSELLTGQLQEKTNLIAELQQSKKTLEGQVADLQKQVSDAAPVVKLVAELRSVLKVDEKVDLVAEIGKLNQQLVAAQARDAQREREGWIAEFVKLEALRPTIALHLGEVADKDAAKKRVEELMARADIKLIADALVRAKAGPNVIVTELSGNGGGIDLDKFDTPEARAAAQRRTGIG